MAETKINWDEIDADDKGFKKTADLGNYDGVVVDDVETRTTKTGAVAITFKFAETDDLKYPRSASHWISWKNDNFRMRHLRNLMMVLGADKEKAQQAVELCESKGDHERIANAYEETFRRLVAKKPKVDIVVRRQLDMDGRVKTFTTKDGKELESREAEFRDSSVYMGNEPKGGQASSDISTGGDLTAMDIPF